ncbi:hypothetical protein Taro_015679 [Colocasia esculenta]|uniref:RNase H type-1 domain-containing protein n=1 Tax=Colocasia esculenta TaxID=4460 RepID=A0A843UN28_COLES|nr:hypothetical protein [Colocasia esculenta]
MLVSPPARALPWCSLGGGENLPALASVPLGNPGSGAPPSPGYHVMSPCNVHVMQPCDVATPPLPLRDEASAWPPKRDALASSKFFVQILMDSCKRNLPSDSSPVLPGKDIDRVALVASNRVWRPVTGDHPTKGKALLVDAELKLNVDGAYKMGSGIAAGGGILRNGNGDIIFAFAARYYDIHSSLEAEALALRDGISLCCERGVKEFHIESDSLVLVQIMKGDYACPCKIRWLAHQTSLGESSHAQGLASHSQEGGGPDTGRGFSLTWHMYIHRHQLHRQDHRQELQSHSLYIHKQGLHNQEGYTHLVPYQMPQTSLSMQPSVLRLLGVHLQLLQRLSERNKSNRSHLSMPYRRGQKNIHQLSNDFMQKEGRHPTRPEMFQMTQARTTPDGSVMWSNEQSRQMMAQMTQLMNPTSSEESDATANPPVLTPEEAFRQVFGRDRPRQIRCGGRGQTLRSWYGPSEGGSSSNTIYQRLLEEQSQQKSEISQQKSEVERMIKIIEDQQQRIEAQSTDIDVRVEAQVEARVEARLAELQTQMLQSMDERLQELIRIRMSGSGAPAVLPEDETEGEEGDGEDEGTFGEDE